MHEGIHIYDEWQCVLTITYMPKFVFTERERLEKTTSDIHMFIRLKPF